jgi:hypothetical protein
LMLFASRGGFEACFECVPVNDARIKILHILKLLPSDEHFVGALAASLEASLATTKQSFQVESVHLLSYRQAKARFSWIA